LKTLRDLETTRIMAEYDEYMGHVDSAPPPADSMDNTLAKASEKELRHWLRDATKRADTAMARRSALPPGTSRARVTTANARWASVAEYRDLLARELQLRGLTP